MNHRSVLALAALLAGCSSDNVGGADAAGPSSTATAAPTGTEGIDVEAGPTPTAPTSTAAPSGTSGVPTREGGAEMPPDATTAHDAATAPNNGVPTPPPYCIAPCIWEALMACALPSLDTCIADTSIPDITVLCDPATGWAERRAPGPRGSRYYEIRRQGESCLEVWFGGVGGAGPPLASYAGAAGSIGVALLDNSVVGCGSASLPVATSGVDGAVDITFGPNAVTYRMDPTRPECDPWKAYVAEPGLATGWELPWCQTTESGSCDGL